MFSGDCWQSKLLVWTRPLFAASFIAYFWSVFFTLNSIAFIVSFGILLRGGPWYWEDGTHCFFFGAGDAVVFSFFRCSVM